MFEGEPRSEVIRNDRASSPRRDDRHDQSTRDTSILSRRTKPVGRREPSDGTKPIPPVEPRDGTNPSFGFGSRGRTNPIGRVCRHDRTKPIWRFGRRDRTKPISPNQAPRSNEANPSGPGPVTERSQFDPKSVWRGSPRSIQPPRFTRACSQRDRARPRDGTKPIFARVGSGRRAGGRIVKADEPLLGGASPRESGPGSDHRRRIGSPASFSASWGRPATALGRRDWMTISWKLLRFVGSI